MIQEKEDICFLIRYGKKEHLRQIQKGVFRFTKLSFYRESEIKEIGDSLEGVESVITKDENFKVIFQHPMINDGHEIDVTNSIISMMNFPNYQNYILSMSYFSLADIENKSIVCQNIKNFEYWDHILFFKNSKRFLEFIKEKLSFYSLQYGTVKYYDDKINQIHLDLFSKPKILSHQKEFRFNINIDNKDKSKFTFIDENVISIDLKCEIEDSVIIPTNQFEDFIKRCNLIHRENSV